MLVPPVEREETFDIDWEGIAAGIQTTLKEYPLKIAGGDENDDTPLIPLICHRVKVQRSESSPSHERAAGPKYTCMYMYI